MKKKLYSLFLLIALSALCSNATNYNYWLVLKDSYFVFTDYSGGKYVYPNKSYFFEIKTNSGMQGSGVGRFTIAVTNGTASKTTDIYSN